MAGNTAAAPQSGTQKRAVWWVWLSLVGSAFGLMSVFNDLIPNLIRLSILFKAAVSAYRQAREWIYDGAQWLAALVGVVIPEIPELVKDVIVIVALILAALNWESVRKFGESWLLSLARYVSNGPTYLFGGPPITKPSLLDRVVGWREVVAAQVALGILLTWAFGLARAFGADPHWGLPAPLAMLAVGTLVGFGIFAADIALSMVTGRAGTPPKSPLQWVARTLQLPVLLPTMLLIRFGVGVANGWRAVMLALALVAGFVALNQVFALIVDPMLADGVPDWLQVLIDADPDALRREQP